MGVNGLRALSGAVVLWGARTLAGDDVADPFKFVPLRRLDLFIEDSITRGLQGATFEPNGPSLWSASARALRISCTICSGKARSRATSRRKRFSCAATPRP